MATFIAGAGVAMGQNTQEQIDALEQQILKLQQQVENGGAQPNFLNQAAAQGLQCKLPELWNGKSNREQDPCKRSHREASGKVLSYVNLVSRVMVSGHVGIHKIETLRAFRLAG